MKCICGKPKKLVKGMGRVFVPKKDCPVHGILAQPDSAGAPPRELLARIHKSKENLR